MSVMTDSGAHARKEPKAWTIPQGFLAGILVALGAGITVVAFMVIWSTVTAVVRPSMPHRAWTVPVSCEIAFLFLFGLGVLLHWRKAPPVASRSLIMAGIIAGSVELNVYASRGDVPALVAHLVVTGAFYSVLLAGKAAFTALRGGKIRADRIGGAEWVLHPVKSAALAWWMNAWGEPSRDRASARYRKLLYARAIAQASEHDGRRVGSVPLLWKRRLPVTLRYELSLGELPPSADQEDWKDALREHVAEQLNLLAASPVAAPEGTPGSEPAGTTQGRQASRQKGATDDAAQLARKRARAKRLLSATPQPTLGEVAAKTGLSERTLSRIKSELPRRLHVAAE